jgi:hypothetical protein
VAGAPSEGVVFAVEAGAPRAGNADFGAESPAGAAVLLNRDGVCELGAPLAGAAVPKSGLEVVSAVVVGAVCSAGLFAPNRPPLGAAAVAPPPNSGLVAPPNILLDGCACEVAGVVDVGAAVGVVEAPGFAAPNKLLGGLDAGGGPAGVVELLPNKLPPAGAGVAVEAALPNILFVPAPPNSGLLAGVVDSVDLLGVWLAAAAPKSELGCVPVPDGALPPKLKAEVPLLVALEAPALPKVGVLWPLAAFPPNSDGDALLPVAEAPTLPKRPPLDALLSLLAPKALPAVPKRLPLEAPVEAGVPKENAMVLVIELEDWERKKLDGEKAPVTHGAGEVGLQNGSKDPTMREWSS